MENFDMFVLYTIMWKRRWHRKRQNMWVHMINIKRPDFEICGHLYQDLPEDEEKFHGFFKTNNGQLYHLSQLVGDEIQQQNTNYRRAITPEERLVIFLRHVL